MNIVRQYIGVAAFEKGIDEERGKSWVLHSWQAILAPTGNMVIIAVFKGRS